MRQEDPKFEDNLFYATNSRKGGGAGRKKEMDKKQEQLITSSQERWVHCNPKHHTLSTGDWDKILSSSQHQTQAGTTPHSWIQSETVGGHP